MNNVPFASIIVLNYNGKQFLEKCLTSVLENSHTSQRFELILVDNGSKDGSAEFVKENFPAVKVLALERNYGFTVGNNLGARLARGSILVFLNNDTIVGKNWLNELLHTIAAGKADICGSRILFLNNRKTTQYAGGYPHLMGGAIFVPFHGDKPSKHIYLVGSICGASFAIRKETFEALSGFDNDFFLYADEGDLCLRALIQGYRIAYAPYSVVYHYGGGSGSAGTSLTYNVSDVAYSRLTSGLTAYYGNRNSIIMLIKNAQSRNLLPGLIMSYLYLFVQLILMLHHEQRQVSLLTRAAIWPIKNLRSIWKKRKQIQKQRKVTDGQLIREGLILPIGKVIKLRAQLRKT